MKLLSSLLLLCFLFQLSHSTTIVVDGVSEWKDPSVHVGDSVIFKHKYHYSLYIFKNQRAFNLCNFTQATLLTKPNSTYTWHPSRPGFFYFTFNNGSMTSECEVGAEKLAIEVSEPAIGAEPAAAPWPFRPKEASSPFISSNPAVPLPTGEVDSATITPLAMSPAHTPHPVIMPFSPLFQLALIISPLFLLSF